MLVIYWQLNGAGTNGTRSLQPHWIGTQPFRDEATLQHFIEGYRQAGLPE